MTQFNIDEQKALSKNINKISYQLGKDLKNLEKNLQIYTSSDISDNDESENTTNFLQHQIKENMNQNLISQFFIFSKKFKLNQEIYSKKCKELLIEDDEDDNENNNIYEMNEISTTNSEGNDNIQKANNDQNFLMKNEPDILLKERDNELDKIVKGVNNLHEMFKDMTILVNEQGTILDRIDYNIDIGYDNVSKGKKKLNQANESKKGSCFRNAILFLILNLRAEFLKYHTRLLIRDFQILLFVLPQIEYRACIGYNIRDFSPVYSKVIGGPSYEQTAFLRYQLSGLDPGSQQEVQTKPDSCCCKGKR